MTETCINDNHHSGTIAETGRWRSVLKTVHMVWLRLWFIFSQLMGYTRFSVPYGHLHAIGYKPFVAIVKLHPCGRPFTLLLWSMYTRDFLNYCVCVNHFVHYDHNSLTNRKCECAYSTISSCIRNNWLIRRCDSTLKTGHMKVPPRYLTRTNSWIPYP